MPTWKIIGVDRESGLETAIVVEASSERVAKAMGDQRGIIVAEVHGDGPAAPDVDIDIWDPEEEAADRFSATARERALQGKTRAPRRGEVICPNSNCGYVGKPRRKSRGSTVVALILLLLFLLPGLIYIMFFSGYRYLCPVCGGEIRSDGS